MGLNLHGPQERYLARIQNQLDPGEVPMFEVGDIVKVVEPGSDRLGEVGRVTTRDEHMYDVTFDDDAVRSYFCSDLESGLEKVNNDDNTGNVEILAYLREALKGTTDQHLAVAATADKFAVPEARVQGLLEHLTQNDVCSDDDTKNAEEEKRNVGKFKPGDYVETSDAGKGTVVRFKMIGEPMSGGKASAYVVKLDDGRSVTKLEEEIKKATGKKNAEEEKKNLGPASRDLILQEVKEYLKAGSTDTYIVRKIQDDYRISYDDANMILLKAKKDGVQNAEEEKKKNAEPKIGDVVNVPGLGKREFEVLSKFKIGQRVQLSSGKVGTITKTYPDDAGDAFHIIKLDKGGDEDAYPSDLKLAKNSNESMSSEDGEKKNGRVFSFATAKVGEVYEHTHGPEKFKVLSIDAKKKKATVKYLDADPVDNPGLKGSTEDIDSNDTTLGFYEKV